MKLIPLTQGLSAQVDDDVFEWASKFKWFALKSYNIFYAARKTRRQGGLRTTLYLHREILHAPPGSYVDHVDGNGLNDLGENIRLCSNSDNCQNQPKAKNNTSGFKGVCWHRRDKKWVAKIGVAWRSIFLGYFEDAESAARAYDRAAWKYFGKFARFNFPRPWLKLN